MFQRITFVLFLCIVCYPRGFRANGIDDELLPFSICGNTIEYVNTWSHLGHAITVVGSDKSDILNRRGSFIGRANNVLCTFGKLDCSTKMKLLKAYCSDFFGCELWDLANDNVLAVCRAWRQAVRRAWCLPFNCHKWILDLLSSCISLYDVFCKRFLNFIVKCLSSSNPVVSYICRHALYYSRTMSRSGRNLQVCNERYGINCYETIEDQCSMHFIDDWCLNKVDVDMENRFSMLCELIGVRDGVLGLSSDRFGSCDVHDIVEYLCAC